MDYIMEGEMDNLDKLLSTLETLQKDLKSAQAKNADMAKVKARVEALQEKKREDEITINQLVTLVERFKGKVDDMELEVSRKNESENRMREQLREVNNREMYLQRQIEVYRTKAEELEIEKIELRESHKKELKKLASLHERQLESFRKKNEEEVSRMEEQFARTKNALVSAKDSIVLELIRRESAMKNDQLEVEYIPAIEAALAQAQAEIKECRDERDIVLAEKNIMKKENAEAEKLLNKLHRQMEFFLGEEKTIIERVFENGEAITDEYISLCRNDSSSALMAELSSQHGNGNSMIAKVIQIWIDLETQKQSFGNMINQASKWKRNFLEQQDENLKRILHLEKSLQSSARDKELELKNRTIVVELLHDKFSKISSKSIQTRSRESAQNVCGTGTSPCKFHKYLDDSIKLLKRLK